MTRARVRRGHPARRARRRWLIVRLVTLSAVATVLAVGGFAYVLALLLPA